MCDSVHLVHWTNLMCENDDHKSQQKHGQHRESYLHIVQQNAYRSPSYSPLEPHRLDNGRLGAGLESVGQTTLAAVLTVLVEGHLVELISIILSRMDW